MYKKLEKIKKKKKKTKQNKTKKISVRQQRLKNAKRYMWWRTDWTTVTFFQSVGKSAGIDKKASDFDNANLKVKKK